MASLRSAVWGYIFRRFLEIKFHCFSVFFWIFRNFSGNVRRKGFPEEEIPGIGEFLWNLSRNENPGNSRDLPFPGNLTFRTHNSGGIFYRDAREGKNFQSSKFLGKLSHFQLLKSVINSTFRSEFPFFHEGRKLRNWAIFRPNSVFYRGIEI